MNLTEILKPAGNTNRKEMSGIVSAEGAVALLFLVAGGGIATALSGRRGWLIAAAAIGVYVLFALKVADQWEKAAVLRFGRYKGLRGPGLFFIVPVIEKTSRYIDQRTRVTSASAESALSTRDTVPVNVDVIVFWMVWDAEKCVLEVADFAQAVHLSAQTALRESIGRHELAQMITERGYAQPRTASAFSTRRRTRGASRTSNLSRFAMCAFRRRSKDAMSRQAQAERERQARIILGTAETEISNKFAEAARVYADSPVALHLRAMNMLYEAIKERGSMVIVPSSAVETMGLGGMLGTTALSNPALGKPAA